MSFSKIVRAVFEKIGKSPKTVRKKRGKQPQEEDEDDDDVTVRWMTQVVMRHLSKMMAKGQPEESVVRRDSVGSPVKGIVIHDQHILEVQKVTSREKSLNPEMPIMVHKKELDGWRALNVV